MMKLITICISFVFTALGTAHCGYILPGSESREEVTGDDGHSGPIDIYPFYYFGTTHRTLYVNTNGAISFGSNVSDYKATLSNLPKQPATPPIIAPFWNDVDLTKGGQVWFGQWGFHQPRNLQIYEQLMLKLNCSIKLDWIFLATWENVTFYNASSVGRIKRNTFQVALARDDSGHRSFVMFSYESLEWASGRDNYQYVGDPDTSIYTVAGFDAGDGRRFVDLPGSYSADVLNLVKESNIGKPGYWIFNVENQPKPATGDCEAGLPIVYFPVQAYCDVIPSPSPPTIATTVQSDHTTLVLPEVGNYIDCHCLRTEECSNTSCDSGCQAGWTGDKCLVPDDGNSSNSCHCLRTEECGKASCHSGCQAGWSGDKCLVPDCSHGNPCGAHSCQLSGSDYSCSCNHGFENANPWRCEDKNECSGGDVCGVEHTCHNTVGSYFCVCRNKSYTQPNPQICILGALGFKSEKNKKSFFLKNIIANVILGFIGTPAIVFFSYVLIRSGGTVARSTYRYATSEPVEVTTKFVRARDKTSYVFITKYEDVKTDTRGSDIGSDIGPDIGTPAKVILLSRGTTAYGSFASSRAVSQPISMSGSLQSTAV